MELEDPDASGAPPEKATDDITPRVEEPAESDVSPFAKRYAKYCGVLKAPPDLSTQHEHYRLGTPKR